MLNLENLHPTEVSFQKKLFASTYSVIFLVNVRGQTCVMKVVSRAGLKQP